jgi:hypothetical protein
LPILSLFHWTLLSVSLAQFKRFPDYAALGRALVELNTTHLDLEKLQTLQTLLPTQLVRSIPTMLTSFSFSLSSHVFLIRIFSLLPVKITFEKNAGGDDN